MTARYVMGLLRSRHDVLARRTLFHTPLGDYGRRQAQDRPPYHLKPPGNRPREASRHEGRDGIARRNRSRHFPISTLRRGIFMPLYRADGSPASPPRDNGRPCRRRRHDWFAFMSLLAYLAARFALDGPAVGRIGLTFHHALAAAAGDKISATWAPAAPRRVDFSRKQRHAADDYIHDTARQVMRESVKNARRMALTNEAIFTAAIHKRRQRADTAHGRTTRAIARGVTFLRLWRQRGAERVGASRGQANFYFNTHDAATRRWPPHKRPFVSRCITHYHKPPVAPGAGRCRWATTLRARRREKLHILYRR